MTSIERTAYPRFKPSPSNKELIELYTPTEAEIKLATSKTRNYDGHFSFLVMLKTFQRLGYFCQFEFVPHSIIDHIRTCLNLGEKASAIAPERSRRRYTEAIRQ
jgi:hypothetical protein